MHFRPGIQSIGISKTQDGSLFVPRSWRKPEDELPLLVAFHGTGGNGAQMTEALADSAEEAGLLVFAPDSYSRTWDLVEDGTFGPDFRFLNQGLKELSTWFRVDPFQRGACGFSDGASYALAVGLADTDSFTHVMAFSPGFLALPPVHSHPRIFLSHGESDTVLPISATSRKIADQLHSRGLDFTFREFEGGHELPPEVVKLAVDWFLHHDKARHVRAQDIHTREVGLEAT